MELKLICRKTGPFFLIIALLGIGAQNGLPLAIYGVSVGLTQSSLDGQWMGGYEIRGQYTPMYARFKAKADGISGTLGLPVRGLTDAVLDQIRFRSPSLHFELPSAFPFIFEGKVSGGIIAGRVQSGNDRGTFNLVRVVTLDAKILDRYVGDYHIGKDRYITIMRNNLSMPGISYVVYDSYNPSQRTGRLFPPSETTFVAGPGRLMSYPVEINATFVKNNQGEVTALKWKPKGSAEITAKKVKLHLYDEEEVKFSNSDVTLAGTLTLPVTKGPHPAVVIILGSDGGLRGYGRLPQFFAQHGIAALTYDKRGWGASTGTRIGSTVKDMAGDAAAGVRFLQTRQDIDPNKVGVWAISQGGWMGPIVAATTPKVAFLILHAAPAVSPRLQSRMELVNTLPLSGYSPNEIKEAVEYQNLYLDAMQSDESYDRAVAAYEQLRTGGASWVWNPGTKEQLRAQWTAPNLDFDPVPFLEKVDCPVLAFFGGKDPLVPSEGNVSIMKEALGKSGNHDFAIKVLPGVIHNFELPGMGLYGYQSSGRTPRGYYDVMINWLEKRGMTDKK